MSDDSDLLIAAAATAAVVTWMGTRRRERRKRGATPARDWRKLLQATREGFLRSWRETPGYQFIQGIREVFFRKRK